MTIIMRFHKFLCAETYHAISRDFHHWSFVNVLLYYCLHHKNESEWNPTLLGRSQDHLELGRQPHVLRLAGWDKCKCLEASVVNMNFNRLKSVCHGTCPAVYAHTNCEICQHLISSEDRAKSCAECAILMDQDGSSTCPFWTR